jgi:ABC-type transporter Mla subunit MlaD
VHKSGDKNRSIKYIEYTTGKQLSLITMNDRTIGYLCISVTGIIIAKAVFFLISKSAVPSELRVIEFPEISGLNFIKTDDPVTLKGMVIGKVVSTEISNGKVLVTVYMNRHFDICSDYFISIGAQGVMGGRFLNIEPGIYSQYVIPPQQHLKGSILPSPPEAISGMQKLLTSIQEFNTLSNQLLYGDSTAEPFAALFKKAVKSTDSLICQLVKKSMLAPANITKFMDTINSLITQCNNVKTALSGPVPSMLDSLNLFLTEGLQITEQIDIAIVKSGELINKYSDQDFSSFSENMRSIQNGLCSLSVMMKSIRENGLDLSIRLKR